MAGAYLLTPLMAAATVYPAVVVVPGKVALHRVDPKFVSFTMDTGAIASAYAGGDLEAKDVLALAKAVGPAYIRLSGGAADSLGYRAEDAAASSPRAQLSAGHCTGGDCGNCDAANGPNGPPPTELPPAKEWFNRSAWRRINAFAAAAGLEIIFGLNSRARASTDSEWDGRFGMAELINWTAAQPLSEYPVVGYELGNEPDLFCRGNSTVLPKRMALDFAALRRRLDAVGMAFGRRYRLLGPDTAGIGSHITNSTTGNPKAIYLHFFSQFANNLTAAVLDEVTWHQYYFKGPTANPSGRQFIDVRILDSLRPKILIATSHGGVSQHGASLGETSSAYDG